MQCTVQSNSSMIQLLAQWWSLTPGYIITSLDKISTCMWTCIVHQSLTKWAEYSPMLDYNPTPNFQKKSEILKISDTVIVPLINFEFWTSVRFAVPSSAVEMKIWKTITGTITLAINNPMQFNHLESTLPLAWHSVIGESLSCDCCLNNWRNKLLIYERNPLIISLHRISCHKVNKFE